MASKLPGIVEAADTLLYEAEAADGFLNRLLADRVFEAARWQRLWNAVASLVHHRNGELTTWESYDLTRIIRAVQDSGHGLVGRQYGSLDSFELQVLEANSLLQEILD